MSDKNECVQVGKIHKPHVRKLGRRGLMKKLLGLGFTATTAAGITIDDIRAASSDQVPIVVGMRRKDPEDPFSERVYSKKNVQKTWYERVQKSRKTKDKVAGKLLSRPGILGVGLAVVSDSSFYCT